MALTVIPAYPDSGTRGSTFDRKELPRTSWNKSITDEQIRIIYETFVIPELSPDMDLTSMGNRVLAPLHVSVEAAAVVPWIH
jgi:hypothetical protein